MSIENQIIEHTNQPDDPVVIYADHIISDYYQELANWATTMAHAIDVDIEVIMFACGRVASGAQCKSYIESACRDVVSEGYSYMYDNGTSPANIIIADCIGSAIEVSGMYDIAYKYAKLAARRLLLTGHKSIDSFFRAEEAKYRKAIAV